MTSYCSFHIFICIADMEICSRARLFIPAQLLFGVVAHLLGPDSLLMDLMDPEMVTTLYNPFTYETGETISAFVYRRGFAESNYGYSAAIDNLRIMAQSLLNIPIFVLINKYIINREDKLRIAKGRPCFPGALANSFLYSAGAAVAFTSLSVFLAYPMRNGPKWYRLFLLKAMKQK